jgi:hypothetical protein
MSDFVQQCRREWERLRVPDSVANEMAADLAADLEEAEAEGVSAEEVLGRSAFDPRSFAASWAAERGVIPSASRHESASRKPLVPAALAVVTVIGLIGAALFALAQRSRSVAMAPAPPHPRIRLAPPAPSGPFVVHGGPVAAEALAWILLLLVVISGIIVSAWLWSRWHRSRPPTAPA